MASLSWGMHLDALPFLSFVCKHYPRLPLPLFFIFWSLSKRRAWDKHGIWSISSHQTTCLPVIQRMWRNHKLPWLLDLPLIISYPEMNYGHCEWTIICTLEYSPVYCKLVTNASHYSTLPWDSCQKYGLWVNDGHGHTWVSLPSLKVWFGDSCLQSDCWTRRYWCLDGLHQIF